MLTYYLFFLIFFFHIADACIFAKTTALLNHTCIFIQIYRFNRVHEICDQSDLAILIIKLHYFISPDNWPFWKTDSAIYFLAKVRSKH